MHFLTQYKFPLKALSESKDNMHRVECYALLKGLLASVSNMR